MLQDGGRREKEETYRRPGRSADAGLQQWDTDVFQGELALLASLNTGLNLTHHLADSMASIETDQKATSSPPLVT